MLYRFLVVFFYRNANRYWQYSIGLCVSIIVVCYDPDARRGAQRRWRRARHAPRSQFAHLCMQPENVTRRDQKMVFSRARATTFKIPRTGTHTNADESEPCGARRAAPPRVRPPRSAGQAGHQPLQHIFEAVKCLIYYKASDYPKKIGMKSIMTITDKHL